MATACAAALAIVSLAAAAEVPKPLVLKGKQTVVNEQKGIYTMTGSLVGAWNVTAFKVEYGDTGGRFVGSGKELFKGCYDTDRSGVCDAGEPSGTLRFTFVYWANYKPGTETLIKGQCIHPVVGGTGGFAKAKGVVHMVDVPTKSGVRTTYSGALTVPGITTASLTPPENRQLASTSRAAKAGCGR
jgi:hypothetical protein